MPKKCKIESEGYAEKVQQLMAEGVSTSAEMASILCDIGLNVSAATVRRFMARIRSSAEEQAFKTITDHVNETLPDDLDALEEMEAICLEWSRQAGVDRAERIAEAVSQIKRQVSEFASILIASDDPEKATSQIIKKCLGYVLADDRRQDKRLAAMRQAHKIIETKLSKAGLLDDDNKGRIVFLQNQYQDSPSGDDGHRPLRLVRGGDNG